MKKHSLLLEITIFCLIFLGFILPPICFQMEQSFENAFSNWTFNYNLLINFLLSVGILYFFLEKPDYSYFVVRIILPTTYVLCVLFFFSLIFKFLSILFPFYEGSNQSEICLPQKFSEWIFCILQFLTAAFYEEVIFRFYLPEQLLSFTKDKKILKILAELFVLILFSVSHLYLGFYAVLNAFFAHAALRFFYKKTGSLIPIFTAHFIYNMISLILL